MTNKKYRGFTLIETLVVIAIIALLAGAIIAYLGSARAKARDSRRKADMYNLRTAINLYYDEHKKCPVCSTADTVWSGDAPFIPTGEDADQASAICYNELEQAFYNDGKPYIYPLPKDPSNETNDFIVNKAFLYRYYSDASADKCALGYRLETAPKEEQVVLIR